MEIITLPVPEKLLEVSDDQIANYVVDISSIKYDDPYLENNKVECSLIYFRNLDLPLACDFSKLSYEEKEEWILKYINSDLYDLCIRELLETILNLLSDDPLDNLLNILTPEETALFKERNSTLLNEMIQFIVSTRVIIQYAVSRIDFDNFYNVEDLGLDLPIIKGKPLFFEVMETLLATYPIIFDALNLYYNKKVSLVIYEYLLLNIEKNSKFYMNYISLPSVKMIGLILNDNILVKKDDNQ